MCDSSLQNETTIITDVLSQWDLGYQLIYEEADMIEHLAAKKQCAV